MFLGSCHNGSFFLIALYCGAVCAVIASESQNGVSDTGLKDTKVAHSQSTHLSPQAYKKVFRINFPVKPKVFKHLYLVHKKHLKKQHAAFDAKPHIPFLRTLRTLNVLFDRSDPVHSDSILPDYNKAPNSPPQESRMGKKSDINGTQNTRYYKLNKLVRARVESDKSDISEPASNIESSNQPKFDESEEENEETVTVRTTTKETDTTQTARNASPQSEPTFETSTAAAIETSHPIPELPATTSSGDDGADDGHDNGGGATNHTHHEGGFTGNNKHDESFTTVRVASSRAEHIQKGADSDPRHYSNGSIAIRSEDSRKIKSDTDQTTTHFKTPRKPIPKTENENKINSTRNRLNFFSKRFNTYAGTIAEKPTTKKLQSSKDFRKSFENDTKLDASDRQYPVRNSEPSGNERQLDTEHKVHKVMNNIMESLKNMKPQNETTKLHNIKVISGYSNFTVVPQN